MAVRPIIRIFAIMKYYQAIIILALLMVSATSRAQYNTYIQKADSLFFRGEYTQSSAMFEKAFQTGQSIEGKDLYNAACAAALSGKTDVAFSRLWARMEKEPNWYSKSFKDDEDLASLHNDARWQAFADSMTVRQKRLSSVPQLFTEYKRNELVSIFSGKDDNATRERIYDILFAIDASQNTEWQKIKK